MIAFVLIHLICLLPCLVSSEISEAEYDVLLDYAKFSSIAYCLNKGLTSGPMSESCELSFCKTPELSDIEIIKTFDFNEWDGVGSGYLAIDHKNGRVILAMRGTSSRRDWIGNFDFIPVPYEPLTKSITVECEGCKIHKGFYEFLRNKCAYIIKETSNLHFKHPEYRLIVTGHSLGAALATLAGIELSLMEHDPLVVGYGSPRVGNTNFVKWVDISVSSKLQVIVNIAQTNMITNGFIRVTHEHDLIPKLPPAPVFRHTGVEYEIVKLETPHERNDINRVVNEEWQDIDDMDSNAQVKTMSPSKLWPPFLGKYEHKHYLIRITGCDDNKS
ncbi:putative lipase Lih1p [[Candida] railenensis]|uniref:triacylglycerol lipase n=1 Tax=[Candida] railenensis TaxID=45579 RepID=A0A9P0QSZ3_9ASCO|nr:putative lipase Lih1p [[Candida] railenensis]